MSPASAPKNSVEILIINERTERFKAVNEIWCQLEQLQQEFRRFRHTQVQGSQSPTAVADEGWAAKMRLELRLELGECQRQLSMQQAQLTQALQQMESHHRNTSNQLNALQSQIQSAPLSNKGAKGPLEASPVPATASEFHAFEQEIAKLKPKVEALEEKESQQQVEFSSLRSAVVDVHLGLPLQAVAASKIALRSGGLSSADRKSALSILEQKEQALRGTMEELRVRSKSQPESVLATIGADIGGVYNSIPDAGKA